MNKIDFYINKFVYVNNIEDLDFSFIPAMLRRRLSPLNKSSFYVFENCFSEDIDNIVYSSRYGEFDKLLKLIDSFTLEKSVSPTIFSSSVHNATVGNYLHINKLNKPYTALSSTNNTLSMGLLNAIINSYDTNLFCYSDYINNVPFSIALVISNKPIGTHYCIQLSSDTQKADVLEKDLLISLLDKEVDMINFDNYSIAEVH